MLKKYLGASYVASLGALGVASCCVLPMTMMLLGLGGSWLAIFGKIAAVSYYVLGFSSLVILAAWIMAYRRKTIRHLSRWLTGTTLMTLLAWIIVFNESRINDALIQWM